MTPTRTAWGSLAPHPSGRHLHPLPQRTESSLHVTWVGHFSSQREERPAQHLCLSPCRIESASPATLVGHLSSQRVEWHGRRVHPLPRKIDLSLRPLGRSPLLPMKRSDLVGALVSRDRVGNHLLQRPGRHPSSPETRSAPLFSRDWVGTRKQLGLRKRKFTEVCPQFCWLNAFLLTFTFILWVHEKIQHNCFRSKLKSIYLILIL